MGLLYPVKFSPAFPIISRRNFDFSDYVLFVTWNGSLVRFVNITNYTSLWVMEHNVNEEITGQRENRSFPSYK